MSEIEWWRLKAAEINALAQRDAVVIVPIGSIEQHGPHLPTQVDTLLVGEIARRAARQVAATTPVVVVPTVWSGLAEHHISLGGTLSLDLATFLALLRCICRSLVRQGFRRIFLLNGHGGNIAALTVAVNEMAVELEAPIAAASYWPLAAEAFVQILERQETVRHACEAETSMMLALAPQLVDMSRAAEAVGPTGREVSEVVGSDAVHRWRSFKSRTSHGAIGDPRTANPEKGERLLAAAAHAVAQIVS
ncbi:MAG: creatininase family protein, partial [Alphaproteobacteria bacterium]|nr:creatininase family protein [Alphaproteobacteria bacterium]